MEERVELHALSKTSLKTYPSVARGTFKTRPAAEPVNDSGYVAWQQAGEAQDVFLNTLVPAKTSAANPESSSLPCHLVSDSQCAQRLGTLFFQRRLLKAGGESFTLLPGQSLALRPADVITLDRPDYGGRHDVLLDTVTVRKDLSVRAGAIRFSAPLDDWADLAPPVVTPATDTTAAGAVQAVLTGGSSTKFFTAGSATLEMYSYVNNTLADDATVNMPDATSGLCFASCNGEGGLWLVQADGTVTKIAGSGGTAAADTDGCLCVFQSGTRAVVKNRLGTAGAARVFYYYS